MLQYAYLNSLNFDSANVLALSMSASAILIGLVAFVYPQIFEIKKRLSDISKVYVKKYEKKFFIENYFPTLSALLFLSLVLNIISIWPNTILKSHIILLVNTFLVFCGLIISVFVYRFLDKHYNKPERQFNIKNILKQQKLKEGNNNDLNLITTLMVNSMVNSHDDSNISGYLNILTAVFTENSKLLNSPTNLPLQKEDLITLIRPLEIIRYLNQKAIQYNNPYASFHFTNHMLQILTNNINNNEVTPHIIRIFSTMLIDRIKNNSATHQQDCELFLNLCFIMAKATLNNNYANDSVFNIINTMLTIKDNSYISYLIDNLGLLIIAEKNVYSTTFLAKQPINTQIAEAHYYMLAYLLQNKKYVLAKDYCLNLIKENINLLSLGRHAYYAQYGKKGQELKSGYENIINVILILIFINNQNPPIGGFLSIGLIKAFELLEENEILQKILQNFAENKELLNAFNISNDTITKVINKIKTQLHAIQLSARQLTKSIATTNN